MFRIQGITIECSSNYQDANLMKLIYLMKKLSSRLLLHLQTLQPEHVDKTWIILREKKKIPVHLATSNREKLNGFDLTYPVKASRMENVSLSISTLSSSIILRIWKGGLLAERCILSNILYNDKLPIPKL